MTVAETALMELAYQIQKYLDKHNMTAAGFSQKCGVAKETVKRAIKEEMVSTREMQQICGVLHISMDSLRRLPTSENFIKMQQIVLDKVQSDCSCSYQSAAKEIVDKLKNTPPFEQSRNIRWLKQSIEHPEMYGGSPKRQTRKAGPKYRFPKFFSKYTIASGVCFTRKISKRQKAKLAQMIEDSKKK